MLFLPFLVVDLVVASITTSIGMLQLPPVVISTPLKLLLPPQRQISTSANAIGRVAVEPFDGSVLT